MKRISLLKVAFVAIISICFLPILHVYAADNTCVLKADSGRVYIAVWDDDSDGDRQEKVFEGWLEAGDRQTINSKTGYIDYSYQLADDDRAYGDNFKTCSGGNTIRVP